MLASMLVLVWALHIEHSTLKNLLEASLNCVGNKKLPQAPRARGGMSGQEQQERMRASKRQMRMMKIRVATMFITAQVALAK